MRRARQSDACEAVLCQNSNDCCESFNCVGIVGGEAVSRLLGGVACSRRQQVAYCLLVRSACRSVQGCEQGVNNVAELRVFACTAGATKAYYDVIL